MNSKIKNHFHHTNTVLNHVPVESPSSAPARDTANNAKPIAKGSAEHALGYLQHVLMELDLHLREQSMLRGQDGALSSDKLEHVRSARRDAKIACAILKRELQK